MTDHDSINAPAPSPELPITLNVDGNIGAVDFVRRLHAGGLELVNADDGSYAVIRLAEAREPEPRTTEGIRAQLWDASGICYAVARALEHTPEADEVMLQNALDAATRIIDRAANELEGFTLEAP